MRISEREGEPSADQLNHMMHIITGVIVMSYATKEEADADMHHELD